MYVYGKNKQMKTCIFNFRSLLVLLQKILVLISYIPGYLENNKLKQHNLVNGKLKVLTSNFFYIFKHFLNDDDYVDDDDGFDRFNLCFRAMRLLVGPRYDPPYTHRDNFNAFFEADGTTKEFTWQKFAEFF